MPANPITSSNFYPHHGGDHVCGKNSPGVTVFIGLLTFTTKLYCIKRVKNDGLHPSLKILYSSGVFFNTWLNSYDKLIINLSNVINGFSFATDKDTIELQLTDNYL
ncbi:MAG: hypothetical protein ABIO44_07860 [Saprospiraceae bacterium]